MTNTMPKKQIKHIRLIRGEGGNKYESMLDPHNRVSTHYQIEYEDGSTEDMENEK